MNSEMTQTNIGRLPDKIGLIYGLVDPRYGMIRYIGQTIGFLDDRFDRHMKEAEESRKKTKKLNWMRKLLSLNLKPYPVVIASGILAPFIVYLQDDYAKNRIQPFFDYEELNKQEKLYVSIIKKDCKENGITCVNGTDGGEGGRTHSGPMREEAKEHLRHPKSESGRRAIREAARKRDNSQAFKNFGDRTGCNPLDFMSEEEIRQWKNNISSTLTGRSLAEEHKQAIRDGTNTPEAIQKAVERNSGNKNPMSRVNVLKRSRVRFLQLLESRKN
jgi:hypothetical protein